MILSDVRQRAWINGTRVHIHSSDIEEGLERVTRIAFVVDVDANAANVVPSENDFVVIEQDADVVNTFEGFIHEVTSERGDNFTRYRVEARGRASLAGLLRVLGTFPEQSASQTFYDLWEEYGPPGLDLSGIETGAPIVGEYSSAFDSVARISDYLSTTTGWAWQVVGDRVEFFNPTTRGAPGVLQRDFIAGTLLVKRSLAGVHNVARQPAYVYRTLSATRNTGGWCIRRMGFMENQGFFARELRPDGIALQHWEFVRGEVIQAVPVETGTPLSDIEVSMDMNEGIVNLSHQIDGTRFGNRVDVVIRRLVWVQAELEGSIVAYGRREAPPLDHDGDMAVEEALRRLEEYLNTHAWPPVELSGSYLYTDIHPGERRQFTLVDPGIQRELVVESVRRSFSQGSLLVQIKARSGDFNSNAGASQTSGRRMAASSPDPLPELVQRLEKLEHKSLSPISAEGSIAVRQGPVRIVDRVTASWGWGAEFTASGNVTLASWDWVGEFQVKVQRDVVADWDWVGEFSVGGEAFIADWDWVGEFSVASVPTFLADWDWTGEFGVTYTLFKADWDWVGEFSVGGEAFVAGWDWTGEFGVGTDDTEPFTIEPGFSVDDPVDALAIESGFTLPDAPELLTIGDEI